MKENKEKGKERKKGEEEGRKQKGKEGKEYERSMH